MTYYPDPDTARANGITTILLIVGALLYLETQTPEEPLLMRQNFSYQPERFLLERAKGVRI